MIFNLTCIAGLCLPRICGDAPNAELYNAIPRRKLSHTLWEWTG